MFHDTYFQGGTTTMTAHLLHGLEIADKKVVLMHGKRLNKNLLDFGYDVLKQNVPLDIIDQTKNAFIMQIDDNLFLEIEKNFERKYNDNITLLVNDVQKFNEKSNNPIYNFLIKNKKEIENWNIITVRQTMKKLLDEQGIKNEFIHHPWYDFHINYLLQKYVKDLSLKKGACVNTRLSYHKKIEMVFDANDLMPSGHDNIVDVWGIKNSPVYNYFVLKLERMAKYWKGTTKRTFNAMSEVLAPKKYLINLSYYKNDGGGTEYSTLEGIYHNCGIIIHRKWIENSKKILGYSDFEEGYNCFAVESAEELKDLLIKNPDIDDITKNAKVLIEEPKKSFKKWGKYLYDELS